MYCLYASSLHNLMFTVTDDLTYYCGSTIFVDREVKVRVRSQTYLNPNQNCTLILRPNRGNRLVASFLGFNLSTSYYYDDSGNCQYESIQLTADGSSQFGKFT